MDTAILYNDLPLVSSYTPGQPQRHHLEVLGKSFVEHKVQEHYAIVLLHKHFHVLPGQVMYHQQSTDGTEDCLPVAKSEALSPHSYCLGADFRFFPYEYCNWSAEPPPPDFLHAVGETLREHELGSIFGICLRPATRNGFIMMETEIPSTNGTKTRYVSQSDRLARGPEWREQTTCWGFGEAQEADGPIQIVEEKACRTYSSGPHQKED